jgi:LysR family glycine cleavage system transcriptional activator
MPRLGAFCAEYPQIGVHLNASADEAAFDTDATDVEIRYGDRLRSGLAVWPLPAELVVPLCSPALMEGLQPIRRPEDLVRQTLIHSINCLVGWVDWLKRYPRVQLDLGRGLRFDRSFMSISAAADGMGVCLESTMLAERELHNAKLVMPFGPIGISVTGHYLVYPRESGALPKVGAFRRWLQAQFTSESAYAAP